MTEQLGLYFDADSANVRAAFDDGRVYVTLDVEHGFGPRDGAFRGCNRWKLGESVCYVHVISKPAGGEIRSYAIVRGALYERGPKYMVWPEMDTEVSRRLAIPMGEVP